MFQLISLLSVCLAYAASVSAQDMAQMVGSLSTGCQAAAGTIATSDFGSCANIMGMVPLLAASGSALPPLSSWSDVICSTSPCSNSSVATALSTVNMGCQADIQKGVPAAVAIGAIISNYAVIRDAVCLHYVANTTRCVQAVLGNLEKAAGKPVTIVEIQGLLVTGLSSLLPLLVNVPKDPFCNDCVHGLLTILPNKTSPSTPIGNHSINATSVPHSATPNNQSTAAGLSAMCGASFLDGKIPSTVSTSASDRTSSSSNPAAANAPNSAASSVTSITFVNLAACLLTAASLLLL